MIITCPACSTRYTVDLDSFQPNGRKVKCANCGHVWHQAPPSIEPEEPAPAGFGPFGEDPFPDPDGHGDDGLMDDLGMEAPAAPPRPPAAPARMPPPRPVASTAPPAHAMAAEEPAFGRAARAPAPAAAPTVMEDPFATEAPFDPADGQGDADGRDMPWEEEPEAPPPARSASPRREVFREAPAELPAGEDPYAEPADGDEVVAAEAALAEAAQAEADLSADASRGRSSTTVTLLLFLALFLVVAVVIGGILFGLRSTIIAAAPGMEAFYQAVGIGTRSIESRLELLNIEPKTELVDVKDPSTQRLIITGIVRNKSAEPVEVPPVVVTLLDKKGEPLVEQSVEAKNPVLLAGERTEFRIVFERYPHEMAKDLRVAFKER